MASGGAPSDDRGAAGQVTGNVQRAAAPPGYSRGTQPTPVSTVLPRARVKDVLGVAGAIQGATTPRDVQSAYLRTIAEAVPAGGHGFYVLDPESRRPVDVAATVPDSFLQSYEDEGRRDDPVLAQALATRAPIDSTRLPAGCSWHTSAVLAVLEQAGFFHSLEAPVLVEGEVIGTLNMARRRDAPAFSWQDLAVMSHVAEQVGAALARARRYEELTTEAMVLADALDAAEQPIVITTVEGQLIFRNRMAARPVPGTRTSYHERALSVLHEALDEPRAGAKRVVTALERAGSGEATDLDRRVGPSPGPSGRVGEPLLTVKAVRVRSRQDAVVSFLSQRQRGSAGLPDTGAPLSPRERGITELVSQGFTNRQIAELSFVSENTVKQHLKRIFAKLDVSSRAELVHAVWQSSTPAAPGSPLEPERPSG